LTVCVMLLFFASGLYIYIYIYISIVDCVCYVIILCQRVKVFLSFFGVEYPT